MRTGTSSGRYTVPSVEALRGDPPHRYRSTLVIDDAREGEDVRFGMFKSVLYVYMLIKYPFCRNSYVMVVEKRDVNDVTRK